MDSKERKEKNKSTVIPLTSMKLSSKLFWMHECWENVKEIKEDQYLIKGYADHTWSILEYFVLYTIRETK